MSKKQVRLSDQIRGAVDTSGLSRYAICKTLGIDQSLFSRFMADKSGLSVENLDALADVLNLRIVADAPKAVKRTKKVR